LRARHREYADVRVESCPQDEAKGFDRENCRAQSLILIFDEPPLGLDVLNAIEVQEAIQELRNDGRTVIFLDAHHERGEKLCDRIAIIHNGRILACDTLEGLRAKTGQHYLETFLSSTSKARHELEAR